MAPQQTTNKRVVCNTHYALSVDACYHVRDDEEDGGPRFREGDLRVGQALPVVALIPRAARGVLLEAKSWNEFHEDCCNCNFVKLLAFVVKKSQRCNLSQQSQGILQCCTYNDLYEIRS